MIEASREGLFTPAGQIKDNIGFDVSGELVHQRLREGGLKNHYIAQKLLLSADAKARRLAFAQGYVH